MGFERRGLLCVMGLLVAGCGGEESPVTEPSETPTAEAPEAPAEAPAETAPAIEAPPAETIPAEQAVGNTLDPNPPNYAAPGSVPTFGTQSDPSNDWVELQRFVETRIVASSNYRNDPQQVDKMTDGDFRTAWNSATMEEGDETPQIITITLPDGVRVGSIGLTAGYTKQDEQRDLFTSNRRITEVRIRHGEHSRDAVLLPEDREIQDLLIDPEEFPGEHGGEWVLELRGWIQGERADWRELAISELRILGDVGSAPSQAPPRPDAAAMLAHGQQVIDRYHQSSEMMAFEGRTLVGAPTMKTVSLANPHRQVALTLPAGRCYAVVAHTRRRSGSPEEPIYLLGRASGPEQWDMGTPDSNEATFVAGLDEVICARNGNYRNTLDFSDSSAIEATIAIFEQGTDPDAMGEDGDLPIGIAAPAPPSTVQREGLHLSRLVVTSDIFEREPLDALQVYGPGDSERIYCFFVLANPSAEATTLSIAWVDAEGETRSPPTTIEVPAQRRFLHYRYTNFARRRPGAYACVLRDAEGVELGRGPFHILEE